MNVMALLARLAAVSALALVGCGGSGAGQQANPQRQINTTFPGAANFVASVTNPYFPLTPETVFNYRNDQGDEVETTRTEVTSDTKVILGVTCTVVHDQVFVDGELAEDTFDWYAQDNKGNVWYFGEDSHEIENGVPVSSHGSWEAGVDGATPGIIMLANPRIGDKYAQEDAEDVAEDHALVLSLKKSVTVPYGSFSNCLKTTEWTPLEPGAREFKYYAKAVGLVLETPIGSGKERNELISIETLP